MAIVAFGNGAKPNQQTIIDDNFMLSSKQDVDLSGEWQAYTIDAITVPGGASGTGGIVAGYGHLEDGTDFLDFSVDTWNSVKNIALTSDESANVVFSNFVHVDVALGGDNGSDVFIDNAKRANVETGTGNDTVGIRLATNDGNYQNTFNVHTDAGSDTIFFRGGSETGAATVTNGRYSTVDIDAGAGNDLISIDTYSLKLKSAVIDGGAGNDTIFAGNSQKSVIDGGTGNDTIFTNNSNKASVIDGGAGSDTFYAGKGSETFVFDASTASGDTDSIVGFDTDKDTLQLKDGLAIVGETSDGSNTQLELSNGSHIYLQGVSDYLAFT